ncbi:efflux RND transporter periplasmic adaptor subunit [uncultured Desulfuromonas sp.]|uniref:efflux RND transporter periplasmic adaptor subunit n=1 Tax=uncultured Desulfuromonas sp. TaxID=181013 RepID=UPI002AAAD841|nr:efflux RND transporter periplasmic adaptor subunit [uncultured Desulfuromonas sp.]
MKNNAAKTLSYLIGIAVAVAAGFFAHSLMGPGQVLQAPMAGGQRPQPKVVAQVIGMTPLDTQDKYIAMVESIQDVVVKPEVSGYLDEVRFKEGDLVKQGELLFTIDKRRYQATVEVRQAELAQARAELERATKYLNRLRAASERSISQTDFDTAESAEQQARAAVQQAHATLNLAKLDLSFCEIHAPISGRIGAALVTKGNYVTPASGELAKIVQMDPIRVVFSMTDRSYVSLRQREVSGTADDYAAKVLLPNKTLYDGVGSKAFADNEMNAQTGTIALRFLFDNPDGLLIPGSYVNIFLEKTQRPMGLSVPQQALLVDAQGDYVLTADDNGLLSVARVTLGKTLGRDREVLSGLKEGDRVVIEGLLKVQPGVTAQVTLQEGAQ